LLSNGTFVDKIAVPGLLPRLSKLAQNRLLFLLRLRKVPADQRIFEIPRSGGRIPARFSARFAITYLGTKDLRAGRAPAPNSSEEP